MPIYEYVCQACSTRYESIVLSSETKVKCPQCGSERKTLQLSVFSAPRGGNSSTSKSAEAAPRCAGNPSICGCQ